MENYQSKESEKKHPKTVFYTITNVPEVVIRNFMNKRDMLVGKKFSENDCVSIYEYLDRLNNVLSDFESSISYRHLARLCYQGLFFVKGPYRGKVIKIPSAICVAFTEACVAYLRKSTGKKIVPEKQDNEAKRSDQEAYERGCQDTLQRLIDNGFITRRDHNVPLFDMSTK